MISRFLYYSTEDRVLRILQITKYYYPSVSFGGPVQCTRNISKRLLRNGHEVTVYTTDACDISSNTRIKEGSALIDGVRIFYFHNILKTKGFFISPGIVPVLRKNAENFDIVHLHEYRTFQNLVFKYLRRRNVPYVLSLHGELEFRQEPSDTAFLRKQFDRALGRRLLKDASKILALTQFEAEQLARRGIGKEKISIVPNAIDPEDFSNLPEKGYFRRKFRLKNEKIVLYVGRICEMKGLDSLIRAFSLLEIQGNLKLVLAGPDVGIKRSLQKLASSLNLGDRILFTGGLNRTQVLAAFNDATVTVYASAQEGFPIVPLESGIMGKPVIVSRHPSMSFVKRGEFGLAVDYGDIAQLKEALERVLTDEELALRLSENGKRFVLNNFTWDKIGRDVESVYREVTG
jgi:glycosyltransferase involved in cell wall biosynthesis